MSQTEITDSLLTSTGFYSLFQTLPPEIRQGFLQLLFQNNFSELEDFIAVFSRMRGNKILERLTVKDSNTPHSCDYRYILYLACENSRKEGFLSELESQSLLESLPQ